MISVAVYILSLLLWGLLSFILGAFWGAFVANEALKKQKKEKDND